MSTIDNGYSVVIPVKNGEKYILQALKSIAEQSCGTNDIFVVDDHSTDSTREIVSKNFPEVNLIKASGYGQLSAICEGLQLIEKEYIAFMDADDYWAPSKQARQKSILEANHDLDAICSGVINFLDNEFDSNDFSGNAKSFMQSRQFGATTFRTKSLRNDFPLESNRSHFQWQMDWWIKSIDLGLKYAQTNELHLYRRIHNENSWTSNSAQGNKDLIDFLRAHKERK